MTEPQKCTCPLIDTSTWDGKPSFHRGDPRGSGCPIHETQEMRDEVRDAEDIARYGFLRHAAVTIEQVEEN